MIQVFMCALICSSYNCTPWQVLIGEAAFVMKKCMDSVFEWQFRKEFFSLVRRNDSQKAHLHLLYGSL